VDPKGKHMRSTPKLPLETPEADPKNIIKKGKISQEELSIFSLGDSGNLHDPSLKTPLDSSNSPIIPSIEISRSLNFGIFPIEIPPFGIHLEGGSFENPFSLDIVK
jgi:hypothetical protein